MDKNHEKVLFYDNIKKNFVRTRAHRSVGARKYVLNVRKSNEIPFSYFGVGL